MSATLAPRLTFVFKNLVFLPDTTLTSSSEVGTLPFNHLLDFRLPKVWRTTSRTGQYARFSFAKPRYVNVVAVLAHNLSASASIVLKLFSDEFSTVILNETHPAWLPLWGAGTLGAGLDSAGGGLSGPETSEKMEGRTNIVLIFLDTIRAKSVEISFTEPDTTKTFIEVGGIWIGRYLQMARNPSYGLADGIVNPSRKQINDLGNKEVQRINPWGSNDMSFKWMTKREAGELNHAGKILGIDQPFLVFNNPDKTSGSDWFFKFGYSHFSRAFQTRQMGFDKHVGSITVEDF